MTSGNVFLSALRSGDVVTLLNIDHPTSSLAGVRELGAEGLLLDAEQGSVQLDHIADLRRAAHEAGRSALVRVPSAEPWVLERYLRPGLDGIVVPRLDTATQMKAMLDDIRYIVPRFDEFAIIAQIESASAVSELDAILKLPRIDALFVGPVDLAKSMGLEAGYRAPEGWAAVNEVAERIVSAGVRLGILATADDVAHWREAGASMLYTHVNELLRLGTQAWNSRMRAARH